MASFSAPLLEPVLAAPGPQRGANAGALLRHVGRRVRVLDRERHTRVPLVNLHPDPASSSGSMIDVVSRFVTKRAGGPAGEAQAWAEDVRGQDRHGRYFFSLSRFLFLAERPAFGG